MPDTEAEILTQLDTVRSRRVAGVRTTRFADREVTYQPDSADQQVEADLRNDLAQVRQRPRQFRAVASKGLD